MGSRAWIMLSGKVWMTQVPLPAFAGSSRAQCPALLVALPCAEHFGCSSCSFSPLLALLCLLRASSFCTGYWDGKNIRGVVLRLTAASDWSAFLRSYLTPNLCILCTVRCLAPQVCGVIFHRARQPRRLQSYVRFGANRLAPFFSIWNGSTTLLHLFHFLQLCMCKGLKYLVARSR